MIQWQFNKGYVQSKVLIPLYAVSHLNLHKNSTHFKGLLFVLYKWESRLTYNLFKLIKLLGFRIESQA